uniref:Gypsy retrotransposon integrase-like protein 1 n=2 Tax=Gouania willdenowi TaxID=441366 RepID=A0A8C5DE49_GOUWI
MKWAITDKFKDYLYGTEFTVFTDNNPLAHLETARLGAVEQRWVAQLANFKYTIKYRPGAKNGNADALSRLPAQRVMAETAKVTAEESKDWRELQHQDEDIAQFHQWKEQDVPRPQVDLSPYMTRLCKEWENIRLKNGVLGRLTVDHMGLEVFQVLIPPQETHEVWKQYHQKMGHPSSARTLAAVRQRCYWPRMIQEIKEWTAACWHCLSAKAGPEVRAPLMSIKTSYPFEIVGLDYLSIGCPGEQYPCILVITDLFSKYSFAVPTKDQSASTTARALYTSMIQIFGCPERILTDRGGAFESALMGELCQLYGCQKSRTTAYHPQGNGACERFNQTLLKLLSSISETDQAQWHSKLPALLQAYNNTVHSTTGLTPHYVVFGRHARLPMDWTLGLRPTTQSQTLQGWAHQHNKTLSQVYQLVKEQSQKRQGRDATRYNRRATSVPLLPGERVLLRNFRRRAKGKLAPRWLPEPFVVVRQLRDGHPVYVVKPEGKEAPTRTLHRNNIRPCPLTVEHDAGGEVGRDPVTAPQDLIPPTLWLPGIVTGTIMHPTPQMQDVPAGPPVSSGALGQENEPEQTVVRHSRRTNFGLPP